MKRLHLIGWLLAGVLAVQNVATGFAAPATSNPLEAHVLQHSGGAVYLYHNGMQFLLERADVGDMVIDAIPTASAEQWNALFTTDGAAPAGQRSPSEPDEPAPFRGSS